MKKILVLLLVLLGAALLEPRSRAHILDLAGPLGDRHRRGSAERALKRIAVDVQRAAARTGTYPTAGFDRWLTELDKSAKDPWGSAYYLEVSADSFVVGSPGPDERPRTGDDVRVTQPREHSAAGLGTALQPPAAPSVRLKKVDPWSVRDSASARARRTE